MAKSKQLNIISTVICSASAPQWLLILSFKKNQQSGRRSGPGGASASKGCGVDILVAMSNTMG